MKKSKVCDTKLIVITDLNQQLAFIMRQKKCRWNCKQFGPQSESSSDLGLCCLLIPICPSTQNVYNTYSTTVNCCTVLSLCADAENKVSAEYLYCTLRLVHLLLRVTLNAFVVCHTSQFKFLITFIQGNPGSNAVKPVMAKEGHIGHGKLVLHANNKIFKLKIKWTLTFNIVVVMQMYKLRSMHLQLTRDFPLLYWYSSIPKVYTLLL